MQEEKEGRKERRQKGREEGREVGGREKECLGRKRTVVYKIKQTQ